MPDTQKAMVERLLSAWEHKKARDLYDKEYKLLSAPIRRWLEANAGEVLYDGERNIEAVLQRSQTTDADLMSMAEKEPALLLWLGTHGCLKLDVGAFKALDGKAMEQQDIRNNWLFHGEQQRLLIQERRK